MHHSRLAGFIIDCQDQDPDSAAVFWSRALNYEIRPVVAGQENYRQLDSRQEGLHVEVQRVRHPSRVHLDIETDDIEAEVRRLEALGARRIDQVQTWTVMEAPTGHRFCVVRPQRADFPAAANAWPEQPAQSSRKISGTASADGPSPGRQRGRASVETLLWVAWWIGTLLVVASWFRRVSPTVGLVGFALAGGSVLFQVVRRRYWKPPGND